VLTLTPSGTRGSTVAATKRKKRIKKRRRLAAKSSIPPTAPGLLPMGQSVEVKVTKASADEIVYTLSDGTRLRVRPLIIRIDRSLNHYNPTGEPLYQVQAGTIVQTDVPKRLKKRQQG